MLFMVIERFRNGDPMPVGERYKRFGRMLPEGLMYRASWLNLSGSQCFQIMETLETGLLDTWISRWDDLADFEVIPVLASTDFWATREPFGSSPAV